MSPSEIGKMIFDFLTREFGNTFTEISCDEDYRTIHVQTSSENVTVIRLDD